MAEPLTIEADEQLLRQALFNLVINAIQAVPANGEIRIRAGQAQRSEAFMEMADNGPGVRAGTPRGNFQTLFHHARGRARAWAWRWCSKSFWRTAGKSNACPTNPRARVFRITHIKLMTARNLKPCRPNLQKPTPPAHPDRG